MTAAPPTYDQPPLPQFIPSTEAVDAACHKQAELVGVKWEDLNAVTKSNIRSHVLTLFIAAGPALVVSALAHVTTNHTAYGFSDEQRDGLIFATFATDHGDISEDMDEPTTI